MVLKRYAVRHTRFCVVMLYQCKCRWTGAVGCGERLCEGWQYHSGGVC